MVSEKTILLGNLFSNGLPRVHSDRTPFTACLVYGLLRVVCAATAALLSSLSSLVVIHDRAMGGNVSISQVKNDFELVIRATKELEWLLETHFGSPSGKNVGLHDKISGARDPTSGRPLPEHVTRKMRKLVTIRNALVHDREVNAIPDRASFVKDWNEVEAALKDALPKAGSSCIVC